MDKAYLNIKRLSILLSIAFLCSCQSGILIEAESFDDRGGWVIDNQSVAAMGSPYLLAHGMGEPVLDAVTRVDIEKDGEYRIWVRTRDWVKPWDKPGSPGKFQIMVNGMALDTLFGTNGAEWSWQDGGTVFLEKGPCELALHDLTGFDGRCDAIWITDDLGSRGPSPRRNDCTVEKVGRYDLVVVGGGIAGCSAAITAARLGCRVALIQDRPVLGGNNSSEVRVGLSGRIFQKPYPKLGALLDELGGVGFWNNVEASEDPGSERSKRILEILGQHPEKLIHNAGPASNYDDQRKENLVRAEKNIDLFLGRQVVAADVRDGHIESVIAMDIATGQRFLFEAGLFADCTGDGNLGFLAGADYRVGRESRDETGEQHAPEVPDSLVMGMSVQWYARESEEPSGFPACEWAMQFDDSTCIRTDRGEWNWEAGIGADQIMETEYVRDLALRAIYGNWSYLKQKEEFREKKLAWVAYIAGKRESRRLMGDIVLSETDLMEHKEYDDATFTTTWPIDLHYPLRIEGMDEEPFLARSESLHPGYYPVPYRCLYSRNIDNLFMAGRDISVTHIALGSVRVMRTGGMMGEVVGMASAICTGENCLPREVYSKHLDELKELMK